MKLCSACGETKGFEFFYSNGFYSKGVQKYKPMCNRCTYDADVARYHSILVKYYGKLSCSRCGYDKCTAALDLHHRNSSEKEYQVSTMRNYTESKIIKELDKCDILCSNCHREVHYELRN